MEGATLTHSTISMSRVMCLSTPSQVCCTRRGRVKRKAGADPEVGVLVKDLGLSP